MSEGPGGIEGRLLNACIALFVGSMALYGAVAIVKAIWLPLCVIVAVLTILCALAVAIRHRRDHW